MANKEREYHGILRPPIGTDDSLFLPVTPTEEHHHNAQALQEGHLMGIPLVLRTEVPDLNLYLKWTSQQLTDIPVIDDPTTIALETQAARESHGKAVVELDQDYKAHMENWDYTVPNEVQSHFFYLYEGLHRRRVEMQADLAVHGIRQRLEEKEQVKFLNFGPGPSPLERRIQANLTPEERARVKFMAVDVSPDLLAYGMAKGHIDEGYLMDAGGKSADEMKELFPDVDVVVYAEILEHIRHAGHVFNTTAMPWLRETGAFLVGSVPNAAQYAEYAGVMRGEGSFYQPSSTLNNPLAGHVTFPQYHSWKNTMQRWGFNETNSGIVSNGVRIGAKDNNADLNAGLAYPYHGDRLIFWGDTKK